ncbi:MAG: glycerol-3-phosphate 1-O-acyltransferase PlsY [Deltaproteobacteria bacterium]|jgi:acyl phosphate:glycerol-3-phosphate acyltransferase
MHEQWILFAVCAYLVAAIPFGKIIATTVARIDITRRGSGNIGATNVARELGMKWGIVTLALDVLKGLVPLLIFSSYPSAGYARETGVAVVGVCALLGHQFSLFMKFRGGKGVATALGVYLAISPLSCLGGLIVFILTVVKWDYISLGSMFAGAVMPFFFLFLGKPFPLVLSAFVMALLICIKHRENIQRLVRGKERKWRDRKDQPSRSNSRSSSSSE